MTAFWILLAVIVVGTLWLIGIYNSLIAKRNQVESIESSVDTQLKRRYDLLPNLVAAVKQYMTHERDLLERVTALRSQAQSASTQAQKFGLNSQISSLMPNLNVALEAYPELKANENILNLQQTLNEIEEQISAARRTYNAAVEMYNNAVQMFPSNIIAGMFNFQKAVFFDIPENETKPHDVHELFKRS